MSVNEIDLAKFKRYLNLGFETIEKEKKPTDIENLQCLVNLIKNKNGLLALEQIVKINKEGNLKYRDYIIKSLALCARCAHLETKKRAYSLLNEICPTSVDLFKFVSNCEAFSPFFKDDYPVQIKKDKIKPKEIETITERSGSTGELLNPSSLLNRRKSSATKDKNMVQEIQKTDKIILQRLSSAKSLNRQVLENSTDKRSPSARSNKKDIDLKLPINIQQPIVIQSQSPRIKSAFNNQINEIKEEPRQVKVEVLQSKFTGWGRAHKNALNNWYLNLKPEQFAKIVTNSAKREKWSHRDILRLSHFKSDNPVYNFVAIYALKGFKTAEKFYTDLKDKTELKYEINVPKKEKIKNEKGKFVIYKISEEMQKEFLSIYKYLSAYDKLINSVDKNEVNELIKEQKFDYQQIPSKFLRSRLILNTLFRTESFPTEQIVKMLSKITFLKLVDQNVQDAICARLKSDEEIRKTNLHPFFWYTVLKIYKSGGRNRCNKFNPNWDIVVTLHTAFEKSFKLIEKNDKKICFNLNVWHQNNASLYKSALVTPFQTSLIMMMDSLHSQPNSKRFVLNEILEQLNEPKVSKEMSFDETSNSLSQTTIGTTNHSLPLKYASEKLENFDVFIIFSNLEPNAEFDIPALLKTYRETSKNQNVKFVCVSLVANKFQVADLNDPKMLDLSGFTSDLPQIILNFIKDLF